MNKISIITVVYNSEKTIRDTLESVQNQSIPVEHIIIDGGSTDSTLDIISEYIDGISIMISEPDSGMYDALNKGIALATKDVIGILHSDDIFGNNSIVDKISGVFKDESIDSCYGDLLYVDSFNTDKIIRYWQSGKYIKRKFYQGWMPPHPTFFVRKKIYEDFGGFNLNLGTAADYELMLRLLVKNRISSAYLPEVITKMRVGGMSNANTKSRILANINDRKAWAINGLKPMPWTMMMKPLRKINQYFLKP